MSKVNNVAKAVRDHRAKQLNPQHPNYHRNRGLSLEQAQYAAQHEQKTLDNRSKQLNPNHRVYVGTK